MYQIKQTLSCGSFDNIKRVDSTIRLRSKKWLELDKSPIISTKNSNYNFCVFVAKKGNFQHFGMFDPRTNNTTTDGPLFYNYADLTEYTKLHPDYIYLVTFTRKDENDITLDEIENLQFFVKNNTTDFSTIHIAASDSNFYDKVNANYICDGVNDAETINYAIKQLIDVSDAQSNPTNVKGGKIILANGHYYINELSEYTGTDGTRKFGIYFPDTRAEIGIEGVSHIHKQSNTSLTLNELGAIIELTEDCYNSIEENDNVSVIGAHPSWVYSHKFAVFKNLCIRLPGNQKNIVCLDMKYFSEAAAEGIFVSTNAPLNDDTNVNPKCIAIRSCTGGNNGYNYYIKHCKILGVGTAFHIAGEHLICEQCSAQRCGYGFAIGNVSFLDRWDIGTNVGMHNLSFKNICFEYCWGGFIFGNDSIRQNAVTIEDLNCEEGSGSPNGNGAWATDFIFHEEKPGAYRGIITYFLISTNTWRMSEKNLWYGATGNEGKNFKSINLMSSRFGPTINRPTSPDYLQEYFDTDLNKMVIWNGENWG